jgi:hypothetical protein
MAMLSGGDGDDMLSQFVRADFDAKELIKTAVRADQSAVSNLQFLE